ncbi:MFS general substrate transporter [Phanerochaete sordida]|uniref:Lysosomal dipeptide transporter MFSD1 n=1 Tax=Phanerochaete sordida TaxID=48140 RepID=A0A9P3L8H3_9APHY|nr:MFS general substrate transporter [Phanerochaete sordida]
MSMTNDLARRYRDRSSSRDARDQSVHPTTDDSSDVIVDEDEPVTLEPREATSPMRAYLIRALALLCACSLSIGSHYASYILGPLKSRLSREMGTNNTEFSLLISAFSLNSTWTPLVGGVLASRLGTTYTSILATGVVFLGQFCLLIGNLSGSVRVMALGMFIFGLGVSPLAVVQETIIVRFFKSHGLGVSLALGLVAGKGASFVSARTSYPLAEKFGPHAPFYAATGLAAFSFIVNLIYLAASKWIIRGAGAELEASELQAEAESQAADHIRTGSVHSLSEAEALKEVAKKRTVNLRDITKLGDVFWAYIGLNVLCGAIWAPFTHLCANIIERRYHLAENDASTTASYLLAGSVFLYPITGYVVDCMRKRGIVLRLFMLSSLLTMACYFWLVLPPSVTKNPLPAIGSFATGHGFSPLLLVVLVPEIVASKYVSTTLGAHKALEQTGSTIFQTLAGVALDIKTKKAAVEAVTVPENGDARDIQYLLNAFLILNVIQFGALFALSRLHQKQTRAAARRMNALLPPIPEEDTASTTSDSSRKAEQEWQNFDPTSPALGGKSATGTVRSARGMNIASPSTSTVSEQSIPLLRSPSVASSARSSRYLSFAPGQATVKIVRTKKEIKRGEAFAVLSGIFIAFAWILFMTVAYFRLRSKEERTAQIGLTH